MSKSEYHEKQRAKDCSIHSFNNALGRKVITPNEVLKEIDKRVHAFAETLHLPITDETVCKYREGLSDKKTFFSPESVWYASAALGRTVIPKQIEYKGKLTNEMLSKQSLIFLGIGEDGLYHAVGARNRKIFDSLNDGVPVDLTDDNLGKVFSKILGVFAFC